MDKLITDFSLGLFFWHTLLFIILVLFLKKFAWKPILKSLEQREAGIKDALDSAEKAKIEMESLNADNERVLIEAKNQRDALLREAREIKATIISDAKKEAGIEHEKILSNAKNQIETEKIKAMAELKNIVAQLSVDIAEKILKNELSNKEKQNKLVSKLIEKSELN